jgi:predicted transposase/invertase (TIGR01784 family)
LNHRWFGVVPDYHLCFRLVEPVHGLLLTDALEFHILELPKFTKSAPALVTMLDKWLYFLRPAAMMDTEALPTALQQEPTVLRAVEELKMLTQDEIERERYEARHKAQMDHIALTKGAHRHGLEEGRQQGLEEGRQEGRQKA